MCLILFAHHATPQYKLVVIANRDEYHQREAKPAAFWQDSPDIFGGIDCSAGGSWLSVDKKGRFAAITNIRKPPFIKDSPLSRGEIISQFLSGEQTAEEFMSELKKKDHLYGLFNLLLFDNTGLWHYSSDTHQSQAIAKGIHGLSNAHLNTPWPKLARSQAALKQQLSSTLIDDNQLLSIMQSTERPSDGDLPNTGVSLEFERFLSSVFIQGDDYGTRCTTLLTIDHKNVMKFTELTYNVKGIESARVQQVINLQAPHQ